MGILILTLLMGILPLKGHYVGLRIDRLTPVAFTIQFERGAIRYNPFVSFSLSYGKHSFDIPPGSSSYMRTGIWFGITVIRVGRTIEFKKGLPLFKPLIAFTPHMGFSYEKFTSTNPNVANDNKEYGASISVGLSTGLEFPVKLGNLQPKIQLTTRLAGMSFAYDRKVPSNGATTTDYSFNADGINIFGGNVYLWVFFKL